LRLGPVVDEVDDDDDEEEDADEDDIEDEFDRAQFSFVTAADTAAVADEELVVPDRVLLLLVRAVFTVEFFF
jgi:hypothetical protein